MEDVNFGSPAELEGLVVRNITKSFPGTLAVRDVSLEVRPGEVLALLGENGAGKSTLSSIIAGLTKPDSGTMTWGGKPYAPSSPREAMAAQIALIHQEMRLLPHLSIAENVFVGRLPRHRSGFVDRKKMFHLAELELQRLGLNVSPGQLVSSLSIAAQQQVEIAKALTSRAQLLLLDEPTAALGAQETDRLFEQIRELKREGVSFVYVSHRLDEIAQIADRIAVMRDGSLVASYPRADVPVKVLVENMVGRKIERLFPELSPPQTTEVLEVQNLTSFAGAFRAISFSVRQGEIFGIAGIVGAGRTELVRAIAGADPVGTGTMKIFGKRFRPRGPLDAMKAGVTLVTEDRKAQGLVLPQSIAENVCLPNYDRVSRFGWVQKKDLVKFADQAIEEFGIKGKATFPVLALSGGNQQKVVLAKWVSRHPTLVILDEPTRGIDVGARYQIYSTITNLARAGTAVIIVSSDLDEVLGMSHRVMVLSRGLQRGILDRGRANNVSVMELATT